MSKIIENQPIKYELKKPDAVSDRGKAVIIEFLKEYHDENNIEWYYWESFKSDWWLINSEYVSRYSKKNLGVFRGKLTTRIAQYFYKRDGHKISNEARQSIGNIINRNRMEHENIIMKFSTDMREGMTEYGDEDSCFYMGRSNALKVIERLGGYKVLFNRPDGRPMGRCWMIPHNDGWMLFNAYGFSFYLDDMVIPVAEYLDKPYRMADIEVDGKENYENLFWINNSNVRYIGDDPVSHIDLDLSSHTVDTCPYTGREILLNSFWGKDNAGLAVHESMCEYCHTCKERVYRVNGCCCNCDRELW